MHGVVQHKTGTIGKSKIPPKKISHFFFVAKKGSRVQAPDVCSPLVLHTPGNYKEESLDIKK